MNRLLASVLLTGLLVVALPGQEPTKDDSKKAAPGATGGVEVQFLNGSKVRMVIQTDKLEIATIYGRLTVPIQDVQAIEFGMHFPEGVPAKIDGAIKNLANGDYRERETAAKTLAELGPYSYAAVLQASRTKEADVARRAKDIAQKLQAKHAKKDLRTMVDDKVVTPTQTIVGRIVTATVKTKADYFGLVDHKLANMRSLRALAGPGQELELSVDAGKYANQGQWMETAYEVDGRSAIVVTAKGMVDTWPQQPGQYMTGPNGVQNGGGGRMGMVNGGAIVGRQRVVGAIGGQMYGGMLLGKIGEDGEPFIIGDHFEGRPDTEGKLYLHIGPSPWNCPSSGAYDVKISRKSD